MVDTLLMRMRPLIRSRNVPVDESIQLNFPDSTIGLALEDRTCDLVLDLLGIPPDTFRGRTITTGATASNIVGLGKRVLNPCYFSSLPTSGSSRGVPSF